METVKFQYRHKHTRHTPKVFRQFALFPPIIYCHFVARRICFCQTLEPLNDETLCQRFNHFAGATVSIVVLLQFCAWGRVYASTLCILMARSSANVFLVTNKDCLCPLSACLMTTFSVYLWHLWLENYTQNTHSTNHLNLDEFRSVEVGRNIKKLPSKAIQCNNERICFMANQRLIFY